MYDDLWIISGFFSILAIVLSFYFFIKEKKDEIALTNLFELIEKNAGMVNDAWLSFYTFKKYFNVKTKHRRKK